MIDLQIYAALPPKQRKMAGLKRKNKKSKKRKKEKEKKRNSTDRNVLKRILKCCGADAEGSLSTVDGFWWEWEDLNFL